ncbi:MAG TPA: hypothetical protein DDY70_01445 [Clostridiales bacterium]|nr:hypothetical protein [Clostridiales bacterium]
MSMLSDFLDVICEGRRIQLSVADVSGILNHAALKLPYKYKIHAKPFCDAAKETKRGYALCVGCKNLCNAKAMREGVPFSGLCPYGLFEAVFPVAVRREVVCVVYCGGGVLSPDASREKCRSACAFTGTDEKTLSALLSRAESGFDAAFYEKIAAAVGRYIYEICVAEGIRKPGAENDGNWVIREIREYTEHRYFEHLSLRMMARRYFMNEKYLGRLFIKECGMSFSSYVNGIRIEEAKRALAESEKTVLDIALSLGYESVTYFNRRFRYAVGLSPTEYRKQEKKRVI